ncbi:MAG: hypothetical protein M0R68_13565 [Bacteroidetes bacterium]|nr:hypothetical protein [Bacteroidota bacterium]
MVKSRYCLIVLLITLGSITILHSQRLPKAAFDDNTKYTTTGNLSVTISNYGVFGHGFRLWPQQPSMQYPRGSGIEHCFVGGLWVGAFTPSGKRVTTGAVDVASLRSVSEGFEFTTSTDSRVIERSTLPDNRFFSLSAISHQDFIADFTDNSTFNPNQNNEQIPNHVPLGIDVHLETYAFNFSFADNFIIFNYTIKNISSALLDSVYVSLWADLVVRNTNITPPTVGSPFYDKGGLGYIDSIHIAYAYDYNGDGGLADSYSAMKFLGATLGTTPILSSSSYQAWQFRSTSIPTYFSPTTDDAKYDKMATGLTPSEINGIAKPSNYMSMITVGPYSKIAAGDSLNVVFALIAAKKKTPSPTTEDNVVQRTNLIQASDWAQRTYNGEDRNGNGIQDSSEIWSANGKPKRYFLPAPPTPPRIKVIPSEKNVDIYWDNSSEISVDPITNKQDFEGYRIYGTNVGVDLSLSQDMLSNLKLFGEFDATSDQIGYNTGFGAIRLPSPLSFSPDTIKYYYKFTVPGLLNGWQYGFAVTAFDSGDASTELQSLESSKLQTLTRVVPGTLPDETDSKDVGVYPNPYYGKAYWDGSSQRDRKIYFYNLPSKAEIRIYTVAGDVVAQLDHDARTYNASSISWFKRFSDGSQILAGGEHAWDLITQNDQAIATGLYLFTVKNKETGSIKRGKFLVVK